MKPSSLVMTSLFILTSSSFLLSTLPRSKNTYQSFALLALVYVLISLAYNYSLRLLNVTSSGTPSYRLNVVVALYPFYLAYYVSIVTLTGLMYSLTITLTGPLVGCSYVIVFTGRQVPPPVYYPRLIVTSCPYPLGYLASTDISLGSYFLLRFLRVISI